MAGAYRDALFISSHDAGALGVAEGERVTVRSETGEVSARIHTAPLRPGNLQMFFPECNPLIRAGVLDPDSKVPDYNGIVRVVRTAEGFDTAHA